MQVRHIETELQNQKVEAQLVNTTDSLQGAEFSVVIFAHVTTKSNTTKFTMDNQRNNVVISRTKAQLIVVGDINNFRKTVGIQGHFGNPVP
jgi:superfamily I DNA and/or RNA helicase